MKHGCNGVTQTIQIDDVRKDCVPEKTVAHFGEEAVVGKNPGIGIKRDLFAAHDEMHDGPPQTDPVCLVFAQQETQRMDGLACRIEIVGAAWAKTFDQSDQERHRVFVRFDQLLEKVFQCHGVVVLIQRNERKG